MTVTPPAGGRARPPGRFVFLCHTDSADTFRVGSHHLVRELARQGHEVVRVALPNSALRRVVRARQVSASGLALFRRRTWRDADGVRHVELDLPAPLQRGPRLLRRAMDAVCARTILRALSWPAKETTACIVDEPRFVGVCAALPFEHLVYRPTDLQDHYRTRAAESALAPLARAVVTTSPFLHAALPSAFDGLPAMVLPNGVEYGAFRAPETGQARPRRVIYIGSLDDRFDLDTVLELSRRHPDATVDVYGPRTPRTDAVVPPDNLTFHGAVDYSAVPALMQDARVGLLPLSPNGLNEGRSPMKLYEYLAAGLNVVCRSIPSLRELELPNVLLYDDRAGAVDALSTALELDVNRAGIAAAATEDWGARAERLADFAMATSPAAGTRTTCESATR